MENLIMSISPIDRVFEIVGNLSFDFTTHRVQIDELNYLIDLCEADLPEGFVKLVRDADGNIGTSEQIYDTRRRRLLSMLEVAKSFPKTKSYSSGELLPTFELSEPDKDRVIKLCSGMRKIVFASDDFDEPHKKRLLNRIAAIEQQVQSKKGLYDVVLGGVSDLGETLGKFGKDIKPLSDRMAEILQITRNATKEYDQLPAPDEVKKLPAPDSEASAE